MATLIVILNCWWEINKQKRSGLGPKDEQLIAEIVAKHLNRNAEVQGLQAELLSLKQQWRADSKQQNERISRLEPKPEGGTASANQST
jgi:hypothetical protein